MPKLPPDMPLKLSKAQVNDLAAKLEEWLANIDHADAKGNVKLDARSVKELKKVLEPILNKIQYVIVESLSGHWPH